MPEINADADKTTWVLNNFLINAQYSYNNGVVEVNATQQMAIAFLVLGIMGRVQERNICQDCLKDISRCRGQKKKALVGLAISKEFVEAQ